MKAAGLVDTLEGPGPFTVFAPTNEAFAKLPAGTVETLLKPENKDTLTTILTYHVVPGRMTAAEMKPVKDGDGKAKLKTVEGEELIVEQRRRQTLGHRRQGRQGQGHDPERDAVERRHPGHQQRAAAGLSDQPRAGGGLGAGACESVRPSRLRRSARSLVCCARRKPH